MKTRRKSPVNLWFRLATFIVLCTGTLASSLDAQEPENLIEYGYTTYGDGLRFMALGHHLIFKVLQDGTVITRKDPENYYTAQLSPKDLNQLKEKLAKERVLQASHYVDPQKGTQILLHGGVAFIRYMDGDTAIVLATGDYLPESGEMKRIIDIVEKALPKKQSRYPRGKPDSVRSEAPFIAAKLHEQSVREIKAGK